MNFKYKAALAAVGLWSAIPFWSGGALAAEPLSKVEAIDRALATTPFLEAAGQTVAASDGNILQANVRPNPQIATEIENFTGTGPFTGLDRTEFTVTYSQTLERGNKRHLRTKVAREEKQVVLAEWHIRRLNIIQRVEKAYTNTLAAKARLSNFRKQTGIFTSISDAINVRVEAGRDSDLAAQNARIQLLSAQNKVAKAELSLEAAKLSLTSLWKEPSTSFVIDESQFFTLPTAMAPLAENGLSDSPDLKIWQLRQDVTAASLGLEKAKSLQDPTFKVGLRYHQNSTDVAAIAGVTIPLAFHDTNQGNIRRAKAEVSRSRYEFLGVERQLNRQLMLRHKEQLSAFVQIRRLESSLKEAHKTKNLVMERLATGAVSYLEVFAAQSLAADIEEQRIAALESFHLAGVEINRLTARFDTNEEPQPADYESVDRFSSPQGK